MNLPEGFLQYLRDLGYHPRSDKHSNALSAVIVQDLLLACPPLAMPAKQGKIVYDLNMDLRFKTATWNVDLVLGTPAMPVETEGAPILRTTPATVRIAIEIKGVMTEHRKAVKNRKRDFEAHHEHVHNYNRRAIAAGVMVVNAATSFLSPLRLQVTEHGPRQTVNRLVEHCVNEMRNVTESGGGSAYGIDAKTGLVVDFDNVHRKAGKFINQAPEPQPGDPLHYDSFLQRLCEEYSSRFGSQS
ncbi:MAG: hypothetical protein ACR2PL_22710 [Dehalococcoidia bacterium]